MTETKTETSTIKPAELPINEKMVQVMKEYVAEIMTQFKADIEKRLVEEKKSIEDELVNSVRTGLGIQKDPVVHLSEVEGMVRKIVLDNKGEAKKSITETPEKPAQGATAETKIDTETAFSEIIKNKGAI